MSKRRVSSVALRASGVTFAGLLFAAACSVGPKYHKPAAPVPAAFTAPRATQVTGDWKEAEPRDGAERGAWWDGFNDTTLSRLERGLEVSNQTIAAAAANVQIARALIRQARAQFAPTITTNPSIVNTHVSSAFGRSVGVTFTEYSLPVDVAWEPDLWGRIRKGVQANTFAAQAAAADLQSVRLSAQAELAADYFSLRAQDALLAAYDSTVGADRAALAIARINFTTGRSSDAAVGEAEALLRAAEAQRTNLGVLRAQYEHAIAVLVGQPASTFSIGAETFTDRLPSIPVGLPSTLLERRPDIAGAERTMAQANAQIGVARAAYYPTLTLSASGGVLSTSLANLLTWPSRVWSIGPGLVATLFDGGLRRATVEQYNATYDQSVANYRQAVLTAFQEVEDNLAALQILARVIALQDAGIAAQTRALRVIQARYEAGLEPYGDVVAAQLVLYDMEKSVLSYRMQRMVAGVQLIKALGGGWDASQLPSMKQLVGRPE